ncbi:30S ribosomal protein S9 [Candidatus Jorgensenbacteria bacterium CG_4_8_14_3_um_filter_38_10]|nr:MAG: 30S ribosomal protein S9 [Candidatus Jorgensenbacteria bacterium CG_4_8_14_3_um_filter_38_10]
MNEKVKKIKKTKKETPKVVKKKSKKIEAVEKKREKYIEALGRRKTAVARVRIFPVSQSAKARPIIVNGKNWPDYFLTPQQKKIVVSPFETVSSWWETSIKVRGGGLQAQAEAVRLGLSRALVLINLNWRKVLKAKGFLKRDPRMVERKKFGLRKARRAQQWRKR